ncbi:Succinate dehydrogenase/fumarate reductase, flavoprotein subunit [Enterobacter sp. kpr-6]|uniref:FAD-dependent oxidoreductase n=1 Tax=Enterobacter sp. kpr-6 TaxID=1761782 RepID=UPI0008EA8EA5|nr:FAD-binding protein [Enterobacter sp. kpr-6]SFR19190.1 Succinate dehydrogenase/fumarate reductase, flavoprotein subunit [Enterobacter sp. kpr-6]
MTTTIPQAILDNLTNVTMPHPVRAAQAHSTLTLGDYRIPVYHSDALVVGSGAAGLRAAVELRRRRVDVLVATQTLFWGTSACSGSDKQTLHTASTSFHGDDFTRLASAIGAGGAMDGDTAYVEAVGSVEAFIGLKSIGLPLPEDEYGAVLRYQTDHDEVGRATSCGPRTSRLMVKVLAEEAVLLDVPFVDHATVIRLLTEGEGDARRIVGAIAIVKGARGTDNPWGLCLLRSASVVLASGGPGELFRDSVYPKRCFGSLGLALEAGIETVNLTEHQFGIGTRRDDFPWNLSGTYVQSMPYIYSVDDHGDEHNFLARYYRTTRELVSNIFRKGYQWPIHATRMLNFGSSLVDLAIYNESQAGRTVYMDFNRNPLPVPGDAPFSLDNLDDDVYQYLCNNNACLEQPIDRLRHMNPLAIELYKHHGYDLTQHPLAFNVNHQHMNGGIAVDTWGHSSLNGCYAVGEAAGTHGVTRPGGAALNAGQVFGLRCAKHIAATPREPVNSLFENELTAVLAQIQRDSRHPEALRIEDVRAQVQQRMSDRAGFICNTSRVGEARQEACALNQRIARDGVAITHPNQAAFSFQWRQMALASEAMLAALETYIGQGGGSRGARVMCSEQGDVQPESREEPLGQFRFLSEKTSLRQEQLCVTWRNNEFAIYSKPLRNCGDLQSIFFEKNWPDFLTGQIYRRD